MSYCVESANFSASLRGRASRKKSTLGKTQHVSRPNRLDRQFVFVLYLLYCIFGCCPSSILSTRGKDKTRHVIKNGFFRFWAKTNFPIEFFNFFFILEVLHCALPPQNRDFSRCLKNGNFCPNLILDICEIFDILAP